MAPNGLCLVGEHLLDSLGGERLGALEGGTEGTVPDQLGGDSHGAGNSEENGVEGLLGETVVNKEDSRVGVDVGPRVLGLTGGEESVGNNLVQLADELEELVIGEVLESELTLSLVTGVL